MKLIPQASNTAIIEFDNGTRVKVSDYTREDGRFRLSSFNEGFTMRCFKGNAFKDKELTEDFEFSFKKGRPREECYDKKGNYKHGLEHLGSK